MPTLGEKISEMWKKKIKHDRERKEAKRAEKKAKRSKFVNNVIEICQKLYAKSQVEELRAEIDQMEENYKARKWNEGSPEYLQCKKDISSKYNLPLKSIEKGLPAAIAATWMGNTKVNIFKGSAVGGGCGILFAAIERRGEINACLDRADKHIAASKDFDLNFGLKAGPSFVPMYSQRLGIMVAPIEPKDGHNVNWELGNSWAALHKALDFPNIKPKPLPPPVVAPPPPVVARIQAPVGNPYPRPYYYGWGDHNGFGGGFGWRF
jgi:hypothetical protein